MINSIKLARIFSVGLLVLAIGCGGSGGGGGSKSDSTIEGTVNRIGANKQETGLAKVNVGALGDFAVTDNNGNFTLKADSEQFTGGTVQFSLEGTGVDTTITVDKVLGGEGVTAYVKFKVSENGAVSAESTDANGNVLSASGTGQCKNARNFGGNGELWKPLSESTGTAVILMPAEYRNAKFEIVNNQGKSVASPIRRSCCDHNGGREHVFLNRSAWQLASSGVPLTAIFTFPNGRTECRTVPNPTQRYE